MTRWLTPILVCVFGWSIAGCDRSGSSADESGANGRAGRVVDLAGRDVDPLADASRITALLFIRTDCPISNRYAPEIRRLHDVFSSQGVAFYLIYVDPAQTADAIGAHVAEYNLPGRALRDPGHVLVEQAGVSVTPEAAVYMAAESADAESESAPTMIYRGRIDNLYEDFGRRRPEPTVRDLQNALTAAVQNTPVEVTTTSAVGCYIGDLKQR